MGGDAPLAATIVTLQTLMSFLTIPLAIAITRAAFAQDPGRYVRAADAGPVTVVGDEGPVMVLSTMEMGDE